MIAFAVHAFRISEDEVVKLHAPLVAFGLLDLVKASTSTVRDSEDLLLALNIAHALLKETSASFFGSMESQDDEATTDQCGIQIANDFYAASDNKSARVPTTGFARRLLANAFGVLQNLVISLAVETPVKADLLLASTNLLAFLADQPAKDQPIKLSWSPEDWRAQVISAISDRHLPFGNVESIIHCLLAVNAAPLTPCLSVDDRKTVTVLIDTVSLVHLPLPTGCILMLRLSLWLS